ncbi:hypothetical protein BB560_000052 [Smittium megazygosporum]|uniref:Protein-serine/threonine kinase n=1 Tax=Smittium megazygosporum TaxID=133381 RepID=A0A2T9ZLM2_9FUNG|nr:hypothetical protein BB560_000052 [Smittium megazygosporum]
MKVPKLYPRNLIDVSQFQKRSFLIPEYRCLSTTTNTKKISFYDSAMLSKYAKQKIKNITSTELLSYGKNPMSEENFLAYTRFCQEELKVRLAKRVIAFNNLPFIVGTNPYISEVHGLYYKAFKNLCVFKPAETLGDEKAYTNALFETIKSLSNVIQTISEGMYESLRYMKKSSVKAFIDDLISSRIGLRVIGEHQVWLSRQFYAQLDKANNLNRSKNFSSEENNSDEDWNGSIHTKLNILKLMTQCCLHVQKMCRLHYGIAPSFEFDGSLNTKFSYIPSHLEYMSIELLKNAFRASTEKAIQLQGMQNSIINMFQDEAENTTKVNPVKITISKGGQSVCIKIQDHGGGIRTEDERSIYDYSFTTYKTRDSEQQEGLGLLSEIHLSNAAGGSIAGLGFGLPMTKVYAGYFGGSLDLFSMPGHGCDAFLQLPSIEASPKII